MKRKFITLRNYLEIMQPEEKLSYSDKSPIDSINLPAHNGIFIAWHGPEALVMNGSTGTAYTCRIDANDPMPLNFDVYSIHLTKNPDIIEVIMSPKQKYHWAEDVPDLMKESIPDWIKEKIKKLKINQSNKIKDVFSRLR